MATEEPTNNSPHPGDYEPGSPESRAAARFLLNDPWRPVLLVKLVGSRRDPETGRPYPDRNFTTARIEGTDKSFTRNEGESVKDFERRVVREAPVSGPTATVVFEL